MTTARTVDAGPADADQASRAPVIVLAPAYSGVSTLRSLLEGHPDLACTSATGLLPLCEQAVATWRNADGRRAGSPSALASAATRALAASIISSILAREGKPRWCEIAAASPQAAETFLRLYPGTRFLCLYRECREVIRAVLDASPWGLTDPIFASFAVKFPANMVASLTAYWVAVTGPLLAFEREHPDSCLRVRYEDLARGQLAEEEITSFLGLAAAIGQPSYGGHDQPPAVSPDTDLPVSLIPPALLEQANDLLQQLDYPALS